MPCGRRTCRSRGTRLPISQRIAAGVVGEPLAPGTAARIFTGAQIPPGADSVVMQEQCSVVDGDVRVDVVPEPGQWIRRRGEDVQRGSTVLAAGMRLSPQALGMAASVGAATTEGRAAAAGRALFHRRRAGHAGRNAEARAPSTTRTASPCAA